ncbi:DUF1365 domain-containing protein [Gallaecimonas xiamenensis]|uniref:Plasmid partition ParA protein n=1 Tax=Gallaecimonas xiamenensis 3-C-1 TaxID=745411 RepID=K2JQD1_9GAMM|nr:DUF1365 domain-containing protein [Gallaecimonas xiamenensis]EKE76717.1 hypothetical protein B3C1_03950 [Gallaecimonas xiamenensis 3-C-1]
MSSALYVGQVRHRRHLPKGHSFSYPFFMWWLDLGQLPAPVGRWFASDRWALARFHRPDYLGDPAMPLDDALRARWQELTGSAPSGKVYGLVNLRTLGLYFSPVNFYYGFDQDGTWSHFMAEVSNTPWNQRHCYGFLVKDGQVPDQAKAFHVSPFNPMDQQYHWRLKVPDEALLVHLENHDQRGRVFDATLAMHREPLTLASVRRQLLRRPVMTATVVAGIYWQALKLALKGVKFYGYPKETA